MLLDALKENLSFDAVPSAANMWRNMLAFRQAISHSSNMRSVVHSLILITMTALLSSLAQPAFPQENPLGEFGAHTDVGDPKLAGSASYDTALQEYTLTGAGSNMWVGRDEFQFVWKKMTGDFILRTRVEFIGKGAVDHRKIGWMVRPSLEADAPYADCARHGVTLTSLQFRRSKGGATEQIVLPITNADVLQFERKGSNFIFSAAHYGEPFVSGQLTNLDLGDEVYAGLYICSHSSNVIEKAVFRDVRIIKPARTNFVPYRDYIGSVLEVLDVQSGRLEVISSSSQPIEAPNWTRDGEALIYNVSGRATGWGALCRFDLATKKATVMDTGQARQNNNDHVLSFDGTRLGISDQSAFHGGQSAVFTVPVGGGTPTPVTRLSPSYLHGWSPDGKFLVYAGVRSNKFDIYKMSSDGTGPEIRLTDAVGVNDGPEYTPDGKYIYFNSSRSGLMQLWRMKPDGQDQEAVTHDEYNNWFPHISPDGKWIAFVSFSGEIAPGEHPYYKQVYLRLMPAGGGPARVIAYVYGGQGTMNVPSWSPDSRRIAFVSNSGM
jgi:Tol biopolymer transport system component